MYNLKLYALYRAKQPIIHTEETIGNISKIKKMRVIHNGKPVPVPALSGNSFRGQFRDILADQMFAILTNNGASRVRLSPNYYGLIYSGGVMAERSEMGEQMKEMADAIPMLRLMGSAFGNVMLPSKLAVTHIIPYAVETQVILQPTVDALPGEWRALLPAEPPSRGDLLFNDGPLTRKDDTKDLTKQRYAETEADLGQDEERTRRQMIYYVECIPAGTFLLQEIYSKYPLDELELGCFFDGLLAFLQEPSLGGRSAAGYGQVEAGFWVHLGNESFHLVSGQANSLPESVQNAVKKYREYVKKEAEHIRNVLGSQNTQEAQDAHGPAKDASAE
ncbi:MAG: hypothetical protein H5T61_09310 [Thermoflexales bacterium]|nr:hypothetical protein [Thermoflexales bacterium]